MTTPTAHRDSCPPSTASRWFQALAVAAVAALGFLLRVLNWKQVFCDGEIRFFASDTFYHMRRVAWSLAHGGSLPGHDLYLNYPEGLHCNWAPLFDQGMAAAAYIVGLGDPSPRLINAVGALTPPVLGALTIPVVYAIGSRLLGRRYALLAAALFAFMPFHIQLSVLGRPDHHVAIVLLSSALLLALLKMTTAAPRGACVAAGVAGLLLCVCLATWVGSLVFAAILGLFFVAAMCRALHDVDQLNRTTRGGMMCFGVAALCLWPMIYLSPAPAIHSVPWDTLSLFHVFALASAATAIFCLRLLIGLTVRRRHLDGRSRGLAVGILLLAAAGVGFWAHHLRLFALLAGGSEWFFKQDPLLAEAVEAAPLSWSVACESFTAFSVAFPLLLLALARQLWRRRQEDAAILLLTWALATASCALVQLRFSDLFCVIAAVLLAFLIKLIIAQCGELWRSDDSDAANRRLGRTWACVLAAAFCLITPAASRLTLTWLHSYLRSAPRVSKATPYELCNWLRNHTPATSGYLDSTGRPEYSVLASWAYGNMLTYVAQRPNVANNFVGWRANRDANMLPYRFFVSTDPQAAEAILQQVGARYVLVEESIVTGHFARMLHALDLPHAEYFAAVEVSGRREFQLRPMTMTAMINRLYVQDAKDLPQFRLVFESSEKHTLTGHPLPVLKVFAYEPQ